MFCGFLPGLKKVELFDKRTAMYYIWMTTDKY